MIESSMSENTTKKTIPKKQFYDATGAPLNEMPHKLAAGASAFVLDAQGRVLLQRRADNGYWGLPAGHADIGESISETAVRETFEETGFVVRVDRLVGVYSDPAQFSVMRYPDGNITQFVSVCLACTLVGGEMTLSDESTDIGFFPLDALPTPMLESHKLRISDAAANQVAACIR
jgi:ADP-ribose pyrophosphatase YjhB (NUDIX family)